MLEKVLKEADPQEEEASDEPEVVEVASPPGEIPFSDLGEEKEEVEEPEQPSGPKLNEEYNPDDEDEDLGQGDYSYGWGYNDAFDSPDEDEEPEILDEDELYARGIDKKKGQS